jgi:hypothetical protein
MSRKEQIPRGELSSSRVSMFKERETYDLYVDLVLVFDYHVQVE